MADLHFATKFHHFMHPLVQWHWMPTFLVGEYLFYGLAIIAFVHAKRNGSFHTANLAKKSRKKIDHCKSHCLFSDFGCHNTLG